MSDFKFLVFSVVMHKDKEENGILSHIHSHHDGYRARDLGAIEHHMLDGDMFLQVSKHKSQNMSF